jgi:hypothetical protein
MVVSMLGTSTPSRIGARTEAAVAAALARAEFDVYQPLYSINGRVDLIYDRAGRLIRVQCKTARVSGTALTFHTVSQTNNIPATYDGQIDEFGVYSPATNMVYLVPFAHTPTRACSLRIAPALNGQAAKIRWAKDYELGPP